MESLSQTTSTTNSGVEFIIDYFNKNTQQTLCFIAIYKPLLRCNFFLPFKKLLSLKIPINGPNIIIEGFNIHMLTQ